jgi:diguanylate cyclase (GGDEF)-like protein/PAS domain S-box-containing protein
MSPFPDESIQNPRRAPTPAEDPVRERTALARKWAYLVSKTAYIPLRHADFERELLGLLGQLVDAVASTPFRADPATGVGSRLVALNCTGELSLRSTVDILAKGLLSLHELREVDRLPDRLVSVFGALAAGYAEAVRRDTFEQQEQAKLALLKAIRDAQTNLAQSEARFEKVATSSASGIAISDLDGWLLRTNDAFGDILGYSQAELAELSLFDLVYADSVPFLREDYQELVDGRVDRIKQNQRLRRKDGDTAWVTLTASLMAGGEEDRPGQFVTVVEDGTELLLLQSELSRQALHDVQTGLPNRQFFTTHLENVLRRADPALGVTLYHLDLDAFAAISDGLGYQAGEQLLRTVAHRLKAVMVDERAVVTRIGADEFAVLVENSAGTPDIGTMVAEIAAALAEPYYLGGQGIAASASIGVVHRPPADVSADELLRQGDLALRRAKRQGRGQWELFHADAGTRLSRNLALAAAMPGAWEVGEVGVRYRPLVRLSDGRVTAVEALLCWDHPDLGPLSHEQCVLLAEETGLILPLGEWLLRRGGQQVMWWSQQLTRELGLTVGFTLNQAYDGDLVSRVVRVLTDTGLPAERLSAGLPCRSVLEDRAEAMDNLRVLADRGVTTVLRDFGSTPGELAVVEDLPVRSVWLAPWLVRRHAGNPDTPATRALAASLAFVHEVGASVVVDGIEQEDEVKWWRDLDAEFALGDFFGGAREPGALATDFDVAP